MTDRRHAKPAQQAAPARYVPLSPDGTKWLDRFGRWRSVTADPPPEDEPGFPEPYRGYQWMRLHH